MDSNWYCVLIEGLAIDYQDQRIWWVNLQSESHQVMSCGLAGEDPRSLDLPNSVRLPSAIAVYDGMVYLASTSEKSLWVVKYDGSDATLLRGDAPFVNTMKIFIKNQLNGTCFNSQSVSNTVFYF